MSKPEAEVLAVTKRRLWSSRFPGVFGIAVGFAGEIVIGYFGFGPSRAFSTALTVAMMSIFALGLVFLTIGTLRINRLGIFTEGVAPPMKPLTNLFDEPYVIPWRSLRSLGVSPGRSREDPPNSYSLVLALTDGRKIRFGNDAVGWRFGSESDARRFYSITALLTADDGALHPELLDTRSPVIQSILGAIWPERGAYRPTRASRVGVAVGGVVALFSGGLLAVGWQQDLLIVRTVFALSAFLFLGSLTTPNMLRRKA